jgi:superfamily II DNA or RNA helicase
MANNPKKYHYSKYLKEAWSSTRMIPDDPSTPAPSSAADNARKARLEGEIAKLQAQLKVATPPVKPAAEIAKPVVPMQKRFAASMGSIPKNLDRYIMPSITAKGSHHVELRAVNPVHLGIDPAGELRFTCTCYFYNNYKSICEHVQAAVLFLDKTPGSLPEEMQKAIAALPPTAKLAAGDLIFRQRLKLGIAHRSIEDSLCKLAVPPNRLPLLKRFAAEFSHLSGPAVSAESGFPVASDTELRRVEWHSDHTVAVAQASGYYFGVSCNCGSFAQNAPPCYHIARLVECIDAYAAKGRGILAEEATTSSLRLGMHGWKWDEEMPPQPWQEAGLSPYEYSQVKKGAAGLLGELNHSIVRQRPGLGHIYQHKAGDEVEVEDDGKRFGLQLHGQYLSVVEVRPSSLPELKPKKIHRLLAADPELARIIAPMLEGIDFSYADGISAPITAVTAPILLGALRLGKLHIGSSSTPAQSLPTLPYRLALRFEAVNKFFRLHLEESLGEQALKNTGAEFLTPWGVVHGQNFRPVDIGEARIQCRAIVAKAIAAVGVFEGETCRDLVEKLQLIGGIDAFSLPQDWKIEAPTPPESCILELRPDKKSTLSVHPFFVYGDFEVALDNASTQLPNGRRRVFAEEIAALQKLSALGDVSLKKEQLGAPLKAMPAILAGAVALGWSVRAEGKITRKGVMKGVKVKSGIDWLAVDGGMNFDGQEVELVDLIRALRKKESYVTLADGSRGWIDPEAARRLARLAALGEVDKDAEELRFPGHQAFLLDVLLHDMGEISFDEAATKARDALKDFSKFEAMEPPRGFGGQLRPYQKDGLGWLALCRKLGLGACLADDMGLGKTVQMLAHLENLRLKKQGPFLVVCPASLLFNWEKEAKKFTPKMKVLVHQGIARAKDLSGLKGFDLIVMTYATLRNDVTWLKDQDFACLVLDEAQAIKNASSASAKAARLLKGQQRLALTGTPVENHLDDLWSLFEYLNPGLLGSSANFGRFSEATGKEEGLALMAKALRPLILRRTKAEVATDLPPLSNQILWCEMEEEQQGYYDKLLAAAKADLLENPGLEKKNSFLMLEKLLRLRQAACSPALCDKRKKPESAPSAKLDALLPMLEELLEEKHQVLIFSQFTEFLAIAAKRLEAAKIPYAYLDGSTKDRGGAVDEFQQGGKNVFLISLKAGGTGLNLVAADYVFLLDPWWNPAVEQQAIDRAHRIGQSRPVTAYRLVAKGSIEEKILELQDKKRALADSLLGGEGLDLGSLQREDLEYLLG